ncbi:zinc finger protein 586-like [Diaphorina citri]|uniref:Zinc finger protein 586-like n=1 Tax=Diaphorina citri TaxID=121845 RepID=A0A3Q0ISN5_DIACI|nr:zinc finger protein 586-like [Diaphorina citri]
MLEIKFSFSSLEILTRSAPEDSCSNSVFFVETYFILFPSNTKNNLSLQSNAPKEGHQISPQQQRSKISKTSSPSPTSKSTRVSPQSTTIVNNNNNNVCIKLDDKKRFKCDKCGASYKHLRNLRAHCHLHTGKTKCDLCNKVLCNRSYFRKHLLHQHGIAENPYEDGDDLDPSQIFDVYRSYFRKHLLHQHGIAENPYEDGDDLDPSHQSQLNDLDPQSQLMSHSVFENLPYDERDEGSEEEEAFQEENVRSLPHSVFD